MISHLASHSHFVCFKGNPGLYTIEANVESVAGKPLGIFVEKARLTIETERLYYLQYYR